MSPEERADLGRRIDEGMQAAVAKAIEEHRKAGRSIAVWRNGEVAIIPAKEIRKYRKERDRA